MVENLNEISQVMTLTPGVKGVPSIICYSVIVIHINEI